MAALWVPFLRIDGRLWMSYAPAEIQSQWVPIQMARGHVAVGGLGMGYVAMAMAARPEVEKVVVFERDDRVLRMFNDLNPDPFPGSTKIKVVMGDLYEELPKYEPPGGEWDLVYMDPYLKRASVEAVRDTITLWLGRKVKTKAYRFWAQEEITRYLVRSMGVRPPREMFSVHDARFFRLFDSTVQLREHNNFQNDLLAKVAAMAFARDAKARRAIDKVTE